MTTLILIDIGVLTLILLFVSTRVADIEKRIKKLEDKQ